MVCSICPVEGSTVILACRWMLWKCITSYRALISLFMILLRSRRGNRSYIRCLRIFGLTPRCVRHALFFRDLDHCHKQWLLHKGYSHRGRPWSSREREPGGALIHRMSTQCLLKRVQWSGRSFSLMKATSCATPIFPPPTSISTISLRTPLLYGFCDSVAQ